MMKSADLGAKKGRGVHSSLVAGAVGVGLLALLGCLGEPQSTLAPGAARGFATSSFVGDVVLGRPAATSIEVSVLSAEDGGAVSIALGTSPVRLEQIEAAGELTAGIPLSLTLENLDADTAYCGRLTLERAGQPPATKDFAFHTARPTGSTYTFCIQADSHPERLDKQFNPDLYVRTLASMSADRPDFLFTLGDDFSVDQLRAVSPSTVRQLYVAQRKWLSEVGAPIFLVNGNHEQAALANLDGTANNIAVWAQTARNSYFPQPRPDGFYSGDVEPVEFIGLLRDYYAFTWGDALFVAIDPYWHSAVAVDNVFGADRNAKQGRDMWDVTLGDAQYEWLRRTLETSDAKYKFVFAHHVNGTGRGGIEQAGVGEWGDTAGLAAHRPDWTETIHQLLASNDVTIFFQGHDHLFARQELDGVIYQTLPEPANPFYTVENAEAYRSGVKLANSGHLRVTVAPTGVSVDYVRSYLDRPDEVATTYTVGGVVADTHAPDVGVILGRPTADSITVSLLSDKSCDVRIAYAPDGGPERTTEAVHVDAETPQDIVLTDLEPNAAYSYRVIASGMPLATHRFHTQRSPGATFTFTVDADPHQYDARCSQELYAIALSNAAADRPDFHINLGDTFMTERVGAKTSENVEASFSGMRSVFGRVASDAALFLANGNHEVEVGWSLAGASSQSLPVWAAQFRQRYFPGPTSGPFYSGSLAGDPWLGAPRDGYYAWTWGAALFVVLDPYWYTTPKPASSGGDGNWGWTLGREQYDWLRDTLASSEAGFKFIFLHHLVGGGPEARGGIEFADLYEWGGHNADGTYGFDGRRPGWGEPIHQILVNAGVSAVFHGHDHVFVKQDLDGIVYQEVPQPDVAGVANAGMAAEYGYENGTVLSSSGYLRITVEPGACTVAYIRAVLPSDEATGRRNGQVEFSYSIP